MSYKSLLFCADEKTARLVTQVLSELDFTVELASDTYATAKKLAEEHFDALVVDCQNEQDASVLFKAARNSAENHSSLSVAVVEGQAGVAKAFRIGANLVLTKPINVEQSKSTLRVARGLLKKNQAKPAEAAGSQATSTFVPASGKPVVPAASAFSAPSSLPPAFTPVAPAAAAAHASTPNVPYSALEVEKEPTLSTEASDLAVLESLPQLPVAKEAEPISAPAKGLDKPFVVSMSAAAAAPAVEKKIVERSAGSMSPLLTQEPIIREASAPAPFEMHAPVPTFSTLDSRPREGSGAKGVFKTIVAFALLGVAFYLGWQKLPRLLQGHHLSWPHKAAQQPAPQNIEAPTAQPNTAAQPAPPVTQPGAATVSDATNAPAPSASGDTEQIAAGPTGAATSTSAPDNIEVQEMPMSRDAKIIVTQKPQPLVVKSDSSRPAARTATPTAPSLDVANAGSNSPIADLVTSNAPLPKPTPGTIRISQGVSQGLLIKKVSPAYPPIAIQLRKEGTVEMLATVTKDGLISNVKVLSGDGILARAAVDAVKQWEYRPYLLNGQPLEVETQISISFKLPR